MVIVVCNIAMCIIFGVPRLPIRPCDERPPAMYGHFCLVPRVSVHDRYYCIALGCDSSPPVGDITLRENARILIWNHTELVPATYIRMDGSRGVYDVWRNCK